MSRTRYMKGNHESIILLKSRFSESGTLRILLHILTLEVETVTSSLRSVLLMQSQK